MIFSHLFLFVTINVLCHCVSLVSSHAYFVYPIPRNVYCANASCTSNGTLRAQGPVWSLPANSTLVAASPTSQTTCNGSNLLIAAPLGNNYDPGSQNKTTAIWQAGSSQTLQIFISQIHSPENRTVYPSDGWQILYRDGTQLGSIFSPIPVTYVNVATTPSASLLPAIGFQLGQTVSAMITVPSNATSDGIFQFFWRNNEVGPGVMWLSCADVTITAYGVIPTPSIFSIVLSALLVTVSVIFNI